MDAPFKNFQKIHLQMNLHVLNLLHTVLKNKM